MEWKGDRQNAHSSSCSCLPSRLYLETARKWHRCSTTQYKHCRLARTSPNCNERGAHLGAGGPTRQADLGKLARPSRDPTSRCSATALYNDKQPRLRPTPDQAGADRLIMSPGDRRHKRQDSVDGSPTLTFIPTPLHRLLGSTCTRQHC